MNSGHIIIISKEYLAMIYAMLNSDISIYPKALREALEFLRTHNIMEMEPGRHPIQGDKMFAVVVDVALGTTETVKPEAHRTYIDVQYWPESVTKFGMFPLTDASKIEIAKPDNDVWYYEAEKDEAFMTGRPGSFAVFFPNDVHRPDLYAEKPETIRKCVVKIDVALLND